MKDYRSRGPGSQRAPLRHSALTTTARHHLNRARPLGDQLASSTVNSYSKLSSAVACVGNFVVIVSVPVSAVAERVTHTVSAFRTIARCDRATAERVGEL
jgi:hypothetical protein